MNNEDIKKFAASLGITAIGIAPCPLPQPKTQEDICPLAAGQGDERFHPEMLLPGCRSAVVCLFPYSPAKEGNLAAYCQTMDYHLVVPQYLQKIAAYLETAGGQQYCLCDTSPLTERLLAVQAGLGFIGDNHCLINDTYGSYCVIGAVLTTLFLKADAPLQKECLHCGNCAEACPGLCLQKDSYDYRYCKSYLTQKKGDLTDVEERIIEKTPLIFGCDECQSHCPHNSHVGPTPIPEFETLLTTLERSDIEELTNRQFKERFGSYAFSWRGKKILLRNMDIIHTEKK